MSIKKFSHDNFILILNHNFVLSNIFRRIFVIIGGNSKMLAIFISFRNFYVSKMKKTIKNVLSEFPQTFYQLLNSQMRAEKNSKENKLCEQSIFSKIVKIINYFTTLVFGSLNNCYRSSLWRQQIFIILNKRGRLRKENKKKIVIIYFILEYPLSKLFCEFLKRMCTWKTILHVLFYRDVFFKLCYSARFSYGK